MNILFLSFLLVLALGLTFGLSIWIYYNNNKRSPYTPPDIENIHVKIQENISPSDIEDVYIPKVVYMTYHDIDGIPKYVMDNIKKYCSGYSVEIYGDKMCEDFLLKYYGIDAVKIFRDLNVGAHKADFWRYCILYVKGGYYFDIKTYFKKHIDDIFKVDRPKKWYTVLSILDKTIYNGIIVTPSHNSILWECILAIYKNVSHLQKNYFFNTEIMYKLIQNKCYSPIHVGTNQQDNEWNCELFQEVCIKGDDRYGFSCHIQDYQKNLLFNTRYNDFPWPKSS